MKRFKRLLYIICSPCRPKTSFTVRYAFPLVFTFAALLGAAAAITSDTKSYISIEATPSSVRAGETFSIKVFAHAQVAVNAVDIRLEFPKNQMEIQGIDVGDSVITLWAQEPYVEDNTVVLQGGTFRRGFRGDHLIATVNARATETGLAQVSIGQVTLLAGDGTGAKVAIGKNDDEDAAIYIADENGALTATDVPVNLQGVASVAIVTDIDGDGQVTLSDVSRFMSAWATQTTIFDFNGDGRMTFRDFGIILADSFLR